MRHVTAPFLIAFCLFPKNRIFAAFYIKNERQNDHRQNHP